MTRLPFPNRSNAGRFLAAKLSAYANRPDVPALALPRGGVPVAYEVARSLGAPLDVFLVQAVEPQERTAEWDAGETPETFPFAV